MAQGEPIPHAEMSAALRFAIQLANGESFDECADDLRAVLTHLERPQWRPIEEAPKDGSRLVLTDGDVPVVGLWRSHDEQWIVDWDHEPYQGTPRETPATHWMPLPPSPETLR